MLVMIRYQCDQPALDEEDLSLEQLDVGAEVGVVQECILEGNVGNRYHGCYALGCDRHW